MNVHLSPIMASALAPFAPARFGAQDPRDLPRATIDASAELRIGSLWIADIEARVTVYRQDDQIHIDEVEIMGQRNGRRAYAGIGSTQAQSRLRELTPAEMLEGLCFAAFNDLLDDARFIDRADEALSEVERDWRLS